MAISTEIRCQSTRKSPLLYTGPISICWFHPGSANNCNDVNPLQDSFSTPCVWHRCLWSLRAGDVGGLFMVSRPVFANVSSFLLTPNISRFITCHKPPRPSSRNGNRLGRVGWVHGRNISFWDWSFWNGRDGSYLGGRGSARMMDDDEWFHPEKVKNQQHCNIPSWKYASQKLIWLLLIFAKQDPNLNLTWVAHDLKIKFGCNHGEIQHKTTGLPGTHGPRTFLLETAVLRMGSDRGLSAAFRLP